MTEEHFRTLLYHYAHDHDVYSDPMTTYDPPLTQPDPDTDDDDEPDDDEDEDDEPTAGHRWYHPTAHRPYD